VCQIRQLAAGRNGRRFDGETHHMRLKRRTVSVSGWDGNQGVSVSIISSIISERFMGILTWI